MTLNTTDELSREAGPVAPRPGHRRAVLPAVLAMLALLGVLALLAFAPPPASGADAPATEFSAGRAERHLREIAQRPHPLGTADNTRVRGYVADTARALGAEVSVQSGDVVRPAWGNPFPAATAHNVIARVPGKDPQLSGGKTLLLVAHYDSVPTGPGAADDGAAVAAMLETMRALKSGGGVRNDVVFLFTDGEELGALGAELFVQRNGVDGYGAVLNWEARGSSGPVMMFETSTGNGPLIDAFADGSSRPVANSLAYEVYKRMPNGSDFTVFRDEGAIGLNAAFLHGFHDYHSPHDDLERLSPDSVQHHGESMLGLVRGLGEHDLRTLHDGGDSVYFDLFARILVRYPADWALPLAGATVLGLIALAYRGARTSALRVKGVLVTAGTGFAAVLVAALGSFGLWLAAAALRPGLAALPLSEPYERGFFAAGFLVLAAAALLMAARLLRGRRPAELLCGVLTIGAVLLLGAVIALPGTSYLFQWPLLAGLPALWWACRDTGGEHSGQRLLVGTLLAAAGPAVAVVLFAPLVDSLLIALGIPLAAVAVLVAAIGGALLLPLLARVPRPGVASAAAAVLALALVGTGLLRSGFSAEHQRPNALVYVKDLSLGTTTWISGDPEPDAWTRKVLGDDPARGSAADYYPQRGDEPVLKAGAPALDLSAPTVSLLADSTSGDTRRVRFKVASQREAWRLQIRLPREPLKSCVVAGVRMDRAALTKQGEGAEGVVFHFTGAVAGVEFSCDTEAGSRLPVDVSDYTIGLPAEVAALVGPRPKETIPVSFGFAPDDSAVVRQIKTL
ncbi:M20/M25/M40 family metallo-hydrolase [Streptomyces atratus]|uniref:Peptidase family M28 n=1 Tax=Streptomyces atratus TaxID=1893 RepID=A0A1K2B321_STRAR|nr:M20/M25/M40 family metallo-hydrolase [Streptomyces atratus]SFX93231.1 Peptidase family M28 [Streptomyces atratus]